MPRKRFSAKALEFRLREDFQGRCAECRMKVGGAAGLEWDHRVPIELGGEDELINLQPLCRGCHKAKTRADARHIAKGKRMNQRDMGIKRQPKAVVPGSRASKWKRAYNRETGRFETVRR